MTGTKQFLLLICFLGNMFVSSQTPEILDDEILTIMEEESLIGLSIVITEKDQIIYQNEFGYADFQRHIPVMEQTKFRIASVSQTITTTALMILFDEGKFQLDDDISQYLSFPVRNPNYPDTPITFRQIMSHTSSLAEGSLYDSFLGDTGSQIPPPSIRELLVKGGKYYDDKNFHNHVPGSYFVYCNINFGIMGTLVEKISGVRFDIFAQTEILSQLDITGSFNVDDLPNINDLATIYRADSKGNWVPQVDHYSGVKPVPQDYSQYVVGSNGALFGPQGGMKISMKELSVFMRMLQNEGRHFLFKILKAETVKLMLNPVWVYNGSNGDNLDGSTNAYGLGIHIATNTLNQDVIFPDRIMKGHSGFAYGLCSNMFFDASTDVGFVFIMNGKQGQYTHSSTSGFYTPEEKLHKVIYKFIMSQPNIAKFLKK